MAVRVSAVVAGLLAVAGLVAGCSSGGSSATANAVSSTVAGSSRASTTTSSSDFSADSIPGHGGPWGKAASTGLDGSHITISCSSAKFCMAIEGTGHSASWDGKAWSKVLQIGSGTDLFLVSVSCTSPSFCMASGGYSAVWNGKSWSAPMLVDGTAPTDAVSINVVSCTSPSFCMGVGVQPTGGPGNRFEVNPGYDVYMAAMWNGTSWTAQPIDPDDDVYSVSCASASFCLAGEPAAFAVWDGQAWTPHRTDAVALDPDNEFDQKTLSCASPTFCMHSYEGSAVWTGGVTWTETAAQEAGGSVSCASTTFCAEAWGDQVDTWNGKVWSAPIRLDPNALQERRHEYSGPAVISCPTASFCATVDTDGNSYHSTHPSPDR